MKKRISISLLILAAFMVLPLSAQDGGRYPKRVSYAGTNEMDISVGLTHPLMGIEWYQGMRMFDFLMYGDVRLETVPKPMVKSKMSPMFEQAEDGNAGLVYKDDRIVALPSFQLEYGHNVLDWLSVGGGVGYSRYEYPLLYTETGEYAWSEVYNVFSVMANFRFYWLNREMVRMYSGVGLGLCVVTSNCYAGTPQEAEKINAVGVTWGYDYTLVGLTVGKSLYGRFELGGGSVNMLSAGIGYRF